MTSAQHLTSRLLRALDTDYNVVDMHAIDEVISVLENINITKELLETTRLGKHVNELRRKTDDVALARRAKLLLKRWRDLIIPEQSGYNVNIQTTIQATNNTPRHSPYSNRGISPAVTPSVTPRLSSPHDVAQVLSFQRQGPLTPSKDALKGFQQYQKRQPLTSPAFHNLSPNITSGHKITSSAPKSISPAIANISSAKNTFSNVKNNSPTLNAKSSALRIPSETVWNVTPSKDPCDSDSNDVIFVDDNVDDVRPTFGSVSHSNNYEQNDKYSKKPRSPVNGGPDTPLPGEELRRGIKRERRDTSSRKSNKKRNHTKSENITVDHSMDVVSVESPFLPISSASTSPALSTGGSLRNGLTSNVPLLIEDVDSKSPVPPDSKSKSSSSSSRKNGCKTSSINVDDYSNFIKNKIPTGSRKVKTTKELLEEMQARKSGKVPSLPVSDKRSKPKKDFLATYDRKKQLKKEPVIVTDIIELNDSNSGSIIESGEKGDEKSTIKTDLDTKSQDPDKPVKFEPVDVILSRLPEIKPINIADDFFTPVCSCTMLYDVPEDDDKTGDPTISKKSIFEMDYDDKAKEKEDVSFPIVNCKESIDPNCHAASVYQKRPAEISSRHVDALHNSYLTDVNGSKCDVSIQKGTDLACRMNIWGLRPYYDCSSDLFHSVVPKYKYLDYSLDKCVKNLQNVILDKYEPADSVPEGIDWFLNLENEHFEKWKLKNESVVSDDYQSAADSPFSEKADEDQCLPGTSASTHIDSDIRHNVSDNSNVNLLDKDTDLITHSPAINEEKESSEKTALEKPKESSNRFEVLDYQVEAQCQPFSTLYSKCVFMDDIDFVNNSKIVIENDVNVSTEMDVDLDVSREKSPSPEPKEDYIIKQSKVFTYEDEVTLLPLSLPALNAAHAYCADAGVSADLSCVFRTKLDEDSQQNCEDSFTSREASELTYSLVNGAKILEMKEVNKSVINRTRDLFLENHDEDANFCGSDDIQSSDLENKLSNSGAFVNNSEENVENCVKNGCPSWIPGSIPANAFREWHEPVVRTSYNEETLTILPYVVID